MNTIGILSHFKTDELTNRDKFQRDGTFTGEDFREKFLKDLDSKDAWSNSLDFIEIDFKGVKKLGPSWANEVFAYFTKYAKPDQILKKIKVENLTRVKMAIIELELSKGYRGK